MMNRKRALTCERPDRDALKLVCGYPLPCPWHTAVIDVIAETATVTVPTTAHVTAQGHRRLCDLARALGDDWFLKP